MTVPDYQARAELYLGSDCNTATAQGPRAFRTAANALRFAFEEAAPVSLHGARLQIGSKTFAGDELLRLYCSADYPLRRKAPATTARASFYCSKRNPTLEKFNYDALAELYPSRRYAKSQQAQYRRFDKAADALRYIIEEMPPKWLKGSFLEVDEQRFEGEAIHRLYNAPEYPLERAIILA